MLTQREIVDAYWAGEDATRLCHRRWTLLQYLVIVPSLSLAFLAALYVVKSAAGIDLFEFHLHDLFF